MARARSAPPSGRREASASPMSLATSRSPQRSSARATRSVSIRSIPTPTITARPPVPTSIIARADRPPRMTPTPEVQTIGKYEVEKVLGRGGMGTVYQARDPVIHRTVALKTMTPGIAETPELKARFLREAQAAGGLRHQNIVTVYDLGEDRRPALHRHGVHRGPGPREHHPVAAAPVRGMEDRRAPPGLRGAGLRAPRRHRPPRRQAREHPRDLGGRGQDHGLRHRAPAVRPR